MNASQAFFCSHCGGLIHDPGVQTCPHCNIWLSGEGKGSEGDRRRIRAEYLKRRRGDVTRFLWSGFKVGSIVLAVLAVFYLIFKYIILRFWHSLALLAATVVGIILLASLISGLVDRLRNWDWKAARTRSRLFLATRHGDARVCQEILVTAQDSVLCSTEKKHGNTVLHEAAQAGRMEIARLLLETDRAFGKKSRRVLHGLIEKRNRVGLTAIEVANQNAHTDIAALLTSQSKSWDKWRQREEKILAEKERKRLQEMRELERERLEIEEKRQKARNAHIQSQYDEFERRGVDRASLHLCYRCLTLQVPHNKWICAACGRYMGPDKGTVA